VSFLDERYGGSLARMFARPTAELRDELLALNGVGPETADSILLYAGNYAVFWWTLIRDAFWNGTGLSLPVQATMKSANCSSRLWAEHSRPSRAWTRYPQQSGREALRIRLLP